MRTYEILDADGHVVRSEEMDDSLAPVLLAGQTARLLALDGERLVKADRIEIGPEADPQPEVETLRTETEAAAERAAAKQAKATAKAEAEAELPPAAAKR